MSVKTISVPCADLPANGIRISMEAIGMDHHGPLRARADALRIGSRFKSQRSARQQITDLFVAYRRAALTDEPHALLVVVAQTHVRLFQKQHAEQKLNLTGACNGDRHTVTSSFSVLFSACFSLLFSVSS